MNQQPKSLKNNFLSRSVVSAIELLFSLISFPYIARVLGPESLGAVEYTNTIAAYFILICSFGLDQYGGRELAKVRQDQDKIPNIIAKFLKIRFTLGFVLLFIYFLGVYPFFKSSFDLFILGGIFLFCSVFNFVWILEIFEEFSYLAIIRILSRLFFVISIFVLVKNSLDFSMYFLLLILSELFYYAFSFFKIIKKYPQTLRYLNVMIEKKEVYEISKVFLFILVQSSITSLPGLVLAHTGQFNEIGLVSAAQRFFWMGYYAIIPLTTILQVRSFAIKDLNSLSSEQKDYLNTSLIAMLTMALPIVLGLVAIAPDLVKFLVGDQYLMAIILLQMWSPLILLYVLNNFWTVQILFNDKKDNLVLFSSLIGLVVSLVSALILIPNYYSKGLVISHLVSQLFILMFVSYQGSKIFRINDSYNEILKVFSAAIFMFILTYKIPSNNLAELVLKIFLSSVSYFFLLFLFKHKLMIHFVNQLKLKFK